MHMRCLEIKAPTGAPNHLFRLHVMLGAPLYGNNSYRRDHYTYIYLVVFLNIDTFLTFGPNHRFWDSTFCLRVYPLGFGEGLHDVMTGWSAQPTLRQKQEIDTSKTDREIFRDLKLGDLWQDADLVSCYRYLRKSKRFSSAIPSSWENVFMDFDAELDKVSPNWNLGNANRQFHNFSRKNLKKQRSILCAKSSQISAKIRKYPQKSANRDFSIFWFFKISQIST